MRESPYLQAVQTALHGAGLPYGYAITVWATGSALTGEQGMASLVDIGLFAAGAMAAYGGLTFLTWETEGEAGKPLTRSPHRVRAGLLHMAAIALAIASAALIAKISGGIAWLLAPLAATLLYLAVSSVEVALVEETGGG
ncbi:MAG: hypothetical protein ACR2FZ_09320 [Thermoleophilaceae bacterium]